MPSLIVGELASKMDEQQADLQELSSHRTFFARGTASPVRLLQGALAILVRKHTSQILSFGT